jgi:hypothetical protein
MAFFDLGILCQICDYVLTTMIAGGADANESAKGQANRRGINRHGMLLDHASAFQSPNTLVNSRRREMSTLAKLAIGRARTSSLRNPNNFRLTGSSIGSDPLLGLNVFCFFSDFRVPALRLTNFREIGIMPNESSVRA